MNVFYVMDYISDVACDSEAIDACLGKAKETGGETQIVFSGKDFFIDRAICIPSDTEILIDGCSVQQRNYVYDNIFRGDNLLIDDSNPYGAPLDVLPLKNIKITGKNGARLIGPSKNRVSYHKVLKEYQPMVGDFWGYRTHMISLSFCEGFEISGLSLSQTMGWAVSFDACSEGSVHDIDIRSDVKNGDGIDFRSGCHHCKAENITGFTSDDTVACTALSRGSRFEQYPAKNYLVPSEPYNASHTEIDGSIHDIEIKNIKTGGYHHGAICLSAWGNKVYNISISDFYETDEGKRESTVKIYTGYGDEYKNGDIHHVKLDNIHSRIAKYAVQVMCDVEHLEAENIFSNNDNKSEQKSDSLPRKAAEK